MSDIIWEKNKKALCKYHKELLGLLDEQLHKSKLADPEMQFEVTISYTQEPITKVLTKQATYFLAGKYSPEMMASRIAERYRKLTYKSVLLVMGLSDGRVLNKLLEEIEQEVTIVVYEPSKALFLHTLHYYNCSALLESDAVVWVVGNEDEEKELLRNVLSIVLDVDNMLNVKVLVQGNYDRLFEDDIQSALRVLRKCIMKLRVEWNTNVLFSENLVENTLKNAKYLYKHYAVDALFHTLPKDVPAIVVAAGPSLDRNIDELKLAQGKACILACDTALKPLLRRGIIPDFFFVVDPSKPMELFENEQVWDIPLVAGISIPSGIMKKHRGAKILCLDSYIQFDMLNEIFGDSITDPKHTMSDLPTGGSVATTAFSAARLMGARTIILVGQDLAFSAEKEHAEGTFLNDRRTEDISDEVFVEDIYGHRVKSRGDFKMYLDWYEEELERYPELTVIDATEGGAKIHGTQLSTLKQAVQKYCVQDFDSKEYLKSIPLFFDVQEQQLALDYFHNMPKRFCKIEQMIKEGEKWYKKLEQIAKKDNYNSKELKKVLKKIKKVNDFVEEEYLTDVILDGVKQEEYLIRTTVYKFDDNEQKNLLESSQMGIRLMKRMIKILDNMWPDIKELGNFSGTYD